MHGCTLYCVSQTLTSHLTSRSYTSNCARRKDSILLGNARRQQSNVFRVSYWLLHRHGPQLGIQVPTGLRYLPYRQRNTEVTARAVQIIKQDITITFGRPIEIG